MKSFAATLIVSSASAYHHYSSGYGGAYSGLSGRRVLGYSSLSGAGSGLTLGTGSSRLGLVSGSRLSGLSGLRYASAGAGGLRVVGAGAGGLRVVGL